MAMEQASHGQSKRWFRGDEGATAGAAKREAASVNLAGIAISWRCGPEHLGRQVGSWAGSCA